jgi:hypothetical protein
LSKKKLVPDDERKVKRNWYKNRFEASGDNRERFRGILAIFWVVRVLVEFKTIINRVESIDNGGNEVPQVAGLVKSGMENVSGPGGQICDVELCKKGIKDIEVTSFCGMKQTIASEACMPVIESNRKIAKSMGEPIGPK